jgi:hypothetical protein
VVSGSTTSAEKPQRRIFDYISKVNELTPANGALKPVGESAINVTNGARYP